MIRLAILGTGGMAQRHAEEFQKIEGVELVACADIHLPVAQKVCKEEQHSTGLQQSGRFVGIYRI